MCSRQATPRQARQGRLGTARLAVFAAVLLAHLLALYWPRVSVTGPGAWSDKAAHVLLFAVPAAVGLLAGVRPAYLLVGLGLHAPVSETLQQVVLPDRSGDVGDAVADLVGVALGALAAVVRRAQSRW